MKDRIKVLYIADSPLIDGAGTALLNILTAMKHYVDILVVFPKTGPLCDRIKKIGINYRIVRFSMAIYPAIHSFRDTILFIPRVLKLLLINRMAVNDLIKVSNEFIPDLIHTNIGPIHIGYNLSKKLKILHVWHIREYQNLGFGWIPIPSMAHFISTLRNSNNNLIAISHCVYEHFQMKTNARVIYDGVYDTSRIPKIMSCKKKYFLFVGRLEEVKGIKELLASFIEFAQNNVESKLLIAGSGEQNYIQQLYEMVHNSVIKDRIEFLGFRSDIYDLMSEAQALIVSSEFEGFGFITAEAMFNGCLVIGNDNAGTKEQFDNGLKRHGSEIGIRYSSHKGLVNSLHEVCNNGSAYYLPMIQRAQETAVNLYSIKQNIKNINELYKEILEMRN